MNARNFAQRFLVPRWGISLYYFLRFHCKVSARAEVELSPFLKIGRGSEIGSFTKIKASFGPLHIGKNCFIGAGCFIAAHQGGVIIGDDCLISPNVTILSSNYNYQRLDVPIGQQGYSSLGVTIGDNVWIGSGVCVLDGSRVGSGVIVTPNSVVSGRIPDNAILQGNPAKIIFSRR
ncbi:MAG: acyltransferase [Candidatus Aminicenantes bacterium]|jgi:acetyltransferase-like isoleucine patch superfamily enzyme|nr:acyltransferase [Candidatus Aminicenantes bacterium]